MSFVNATVIAILYFLFRFFEMRVILKENKPLKTLLRESLLVYVSVVVGFFLINEITPIASGITSEPTVFVNEPDF